MTTIRSAAMYIQPSRPFSHAPQSPRFQGIDPFKDADKEELLAMIIEEMRQATPQQMDRAFQKSSDYQDFCIEWLHLSRGYELLKVVYPKLSFEKQGTLMNAVKAWLDRPILKSSRKPSSFEQRFSEAFDTVTKPAIESDPAIRRQWLKKIVTDKDGMNLLHEVWAKFSPATQENLLQDLKSILLE